MGWVKRPRKKWIRNYKVNFDPKDNNACNKTYGIDSSGYGKNGHLILQAWKKAIYDKLLTLEGKVMVLCALGLFIEFVEKYWDYVGDRKGWLE